MFIEFRQVLLEDEEILEGVPCAICGCRFDTKSVVAEAIGNSLFGPDCPGDQEGPTCPVCVEYLGERNPERFPTIEEYEEALRLYPEPVFASVEELNRADREGTFNAAYNASWITEVVSSEQGGEG